MRGPASLEELAGDESFRELVRRRYPGQGPLWHDRLSRRRFLALMAASLGLAGLSGCNLQPPVETIVPYVRAPEGMIPGKPLFFATTMTLCGDAIGLLVESHEGRPTKIEGNPLHPASLGATDAPTQAAVLGLYDPDRSQTVLYRGQIRSWDDALEAIRSGIAAQGEKQGAGLRLLTETVISPTLASQIHALLGQYPRAKWHQYEPAGRDMARRGARLAFGQDVNTYYRFDRAERILSLDADFLSAGPGHLRYARDFAARRRFSPCGAGVTGKGDRHLLGEAGHQPQVGRGPFRQKVPVTFSGPGMSRLYMVQSTPTITGAKADHCWPLRASQVEAFARAVAARLDDQFRPLAPAGFTAIPQETLDAIAADLGGHRGSSVVIAGEEQPPAVHALAHAMNRALDSAGQTVIYTDPIEARSEDQIASLGQLVEDMDRGLVEALLILGGNPVYTAPADFRFGERLLALSSDGKPKVPLRIHLSLYVDETSARCDWHLPEAHYLESWSDARAYDGTASIVQPLIAPLYGGKSSHEVLAALLASKAGEAQRSAYELVRSHWRGVWEGGHRNRSGQTERDRTADGRRWTQTSQGSPEREDEFARFWRAALHDGAVAGTAFAPKKVALRKDLVKELAAGGRAGASEPGATTGDRLELALRPDPTVLDGRFANNGWLQELPKPLTRLTWGNAVLMSPAMMGCLPTN